MGSGGPSITLYQIFPFGGNRAENFIVLDLHKGQPGSSWNGDISQIKRKRKNSQTEDYTFPLGIVFLSSVNGVCFQLKNNAARMVVELEGNYILIPWEHCDLMTRRNYILCNI